MNIFIFFGGIILSIIIILTILRIWFNSLEKKTESIDALTHLFQDISRRIDTSSFQIDQKLSHNMDMFNERLDKAAVVIGDVKRHIGEFSEIGRSMKDLQEFLRSPKLRGNIGEQILKELLTQYFPHDTYVLQYEFNNGEKVDAVIKTSQGLIPIDSKFPLENYRKLISTTIEDEQIKIRKELERDVKKHIQDISRKYIVVQEKTVDYALMYIPSEAVFYEIINNAELFDFATQKRIVPVSPMSFYAYMKAILMSFEGQRIQAKAKEIIEILQSIKKDYEKTDEAFSILQKHITNAYNQTAQVSKNFLSIGQKLTSTRLLSDKTEKNEHLL